MALGARGGTRKSLAGPGRGAKRSGVKNAVGPLPIAAFLALGAVATAGGWLMMWTAGASSASRAPRFDSHRASLAALAATDAQSSGLQPDSRRILAEPQPEQHGDEFRTPAHVVANFPVALPVSPAASATSQNSFGPSQLSSSSPSIPPSDSARATLSAAAPSLSAAETAASVLPTALVAVPPAAPLAAGRHRKRLRRIDCASASSHAVSFVVDPAQAAAMAVGLNRGMAAMLRALALGAQRRPSAAMELRFARDARGADLRIAFPPHGPRSTEDALARLRFFHACIFEHGEAPGLPPASARMRPSSKYLGPSVLDPPAYAIEPFLRAAADPGWREGLRKHAAEVMTQTAIVRGARPHNHGGYAGPWVENHWLDTFAANFDYDAFEPLVPLFLPWTDFMARAGFSLSSFSTVAALLLPVLRKDVLYVTVVQYLEGLHLHTDIHARMAGYNILVLSAGGFGHVALPLLKGELPIDPQGPPPPQVGALPAWGPASLLRGVDAEARACAATGGTAAALFRGADEEAGGVAPASARLLPASALRKYTVSFAGSLYPGTREAMAAALHAADGEAGGGGPGGLLLPPEEAAALCPLELSDEAVAAAAADGGLSASALREAGVAAAALAGSLPRARSSVYKGDGWKEIMHYSAFQLAPRGIGRTSFRLYEALQMGMVPIYVYDDVEWLPYQRAPRGHGPKFAPFKPTTVSGHPSSAAWWHPPLADAERGWLAQAAAAAGPQSRARTRALQQALTAILTDAPLPAAARLLAAVRTRFAVLARRGAPEAVPCGSHQAAAVLRGGTASTAAVASKVAADLLEEAGEADAEEQSPLDPQDAHLLSVLRQVARVMATACGPGHGADADAGAEEELWPSLGFSVHAFEWPHLLRLLPALERRADLMACLRANAVAARGAFFTYEAIMRHVHTFVAAPETSWLTCGPVPPTSM